MTGILVVVVLLLEYECAEPEFGWHSSPHKPQDGWRRSGQGSTLKQGVSVDDCTLPPGLVANQFVLQEDKLLQDVQLTEGTLSHKLLRLQTGKVDFSTWMNIGETDLSVAMNVGI